MLRTGSATFVTRCSPGARRGIDRTQINSWEDVEFRKAVEATNRKKLIMCALWTEVCLAFPALDAMRAGYEVFPVVDAVGGTSVEAHRAREHTLKASGVQLDPNSKVCS
jgi:nicotinamidase-related amidase